MLSQFIDAYNSNVDIEVILVLGALKCGLYSANEQTSKLCMQLLYRLLESLRES